MRRREKNRLSKMKKRNIMKMKLMSKSWNRIMRARKDKKSEKMIIMSSSLAKKMMIMIGMRRLNHNHKYQSKERKIMKLCKIDNEEEYEGVYKRYTYCRN
jgi:hypothetical protein